VIDGASNVLVALPDGRRIPTSMVLAWNRKQDWAVLSVPGIRASGLQKVKLEGWTIGDRCFTLDTQGDGGRVIVESSIIGKQNLSGAGERINISVGLNDESIGSPLLDEYGDVVGMIGGSLVPGAVSLKGARFGFPHLSLRLPGVVRGEVAIPIHRIPSPAPETNLASLEDLRRSGQFVSPLLASRHVSWGVLARSIDRKGPIPTAVDERAEFLRRDTTMSLLVTWTPARK
jgi:hypothetical protein